MAILWKSNVTNVYQNNMYPVPSVSKHYAKYLMYVVLFHLNCNFYSPRE